MQMGINGKASTICAVVIGGYVNGYSIIRELSDRGVSNLILLDYVRSIGAYSKLITSFKIIQKDPIALKGCLEKIHEDYDYLVIFPTDDIHIEHLLSIYSEIVDFCFIPFNPKNALMGMDKLYQYEFCRELGVPYPETRLIQKSEDLDILKELKYPLVVKPRRRYSQTNYKFKGIIAQSVKEMESHWLFFSDTVKNGVHLLASEFIPGDDTNIYAYVAYRSPRGKIVNEWVGKKLNQHPGEIGVFSSASNQAPDLVLEQGRALVEGMDLWGICEPEFKYDYRCGEYKLTEINLRPMMWHRVGCLSGVDLLYSQYLDAIGGNICKLRQDRTKNIHLVYMVHEISNFIFRSGYSRNFLSNIFNCDELHFALLNRKDLKPCIYNFKELLRTVCGRAIRNFRILSNILITLTSYLINIEKFM